MDSFYQNFYLAFVEIIEKIIDMLGRIKKRKKKGIKKLLYIFLILSFPYSNNCQILQEDIIFSLLLVNMKIHAQLAIKNLFIGMVGILHFQTDTLKNDHGKRKARKRNIFFLFFFSERPYIPSNMQHAK